MDEVPMNQKASEVIALDVESSPSIFDSSTTPTQPLKQILATEQAANHGSNDDEPDTKRSRQTSDVWNFFERLNKQKSSCNFCKSILSSQPSSGNSHLRRHLLKCKKRVNKDIKQFLVPTDATQGQNSLRTYKFDMLDLRKCICLFIVEGNLAFSVVKLRGFRIMMSRSNPQFEPFSRQTLKREIQKLYDSEKEKVKEMFKNGNGRICLTTDNWRNEHNREEFICVTAHFVDNNWKLQKRIIYFKDLDPPFDGRCIADEIFMTILAWNIQDKVLTITTDNASYNDVMINNVKNHLLAKKCLVKKGEFFQIRCFPHIVNLIVQSGLAAIKEPLDKICCVVKCISRSPIRSKKFFAFAQKSFELETKRKFRLDMHVRWNSTFKMLDNVLYYKDALISFCGRDHGLNSFSLSSFEWDNVTLIHKFFNTFYDVTCMFSAMRTPTAKVYFLGVWMIQKALLEASQGEFNVLTDIVDPMQYKFNKYWLEYNEVLSCAALLDPRYKEKFLGYCYTKIYGKDNAMSYVAKVVGNLHALFEEYKNYDSRTSKEGVSGCNKNSIGGKTAEIYSDYEMFIAETSFCLEKSQLDLYLAEPTLKLEEDLDVLDFWNKSSMRYPELARMAQDILAIPISTVASESAFSTGGKIITSARSSLKPKTIQTLMCLKDWLKAQDESNLMGIEETDSSSEDDEEVDVDSSNDSGLSDLF